MSDRKALNFTVSAQLHTAIWYAAQAERMSMAAWIDRALQRTLSGDEPVATVLARLEGTCDRILDVLSSQEPKR